MGIRTTQSRQFEFWNGDVGKRWASSHETMEALMAPLDEAVFERISLPEDARVLDAGCGCGSSTLRLAQMASQVTAVDLSGPMLEIARERAATSSSVVEFLQADAGTHPFEMGTYDLVFSRFGVMFFDDPVEAFAHLRGTLKPDGRLTFLCWRAADENPWMTLPRASVQQYLPPQEPQPQGAPGPFAFADFDYVRSILSEAGFGEIDAERIDVDITLGRGGDLSESIAFFEKIGPLSAALSNVPSDRREMIREALSDALAPYHTDEGLKLGAACWLFSASP